jgi:hypothetical protein
MVMVMNTFIPRYPEAETGNIRVSRPSGAKKFMRPQVHYLNRKKLSVVAYGLSS